MRVPALLLFVAVAGATVADPAACTTDGEGRTCVHTHRTEVGADGGAAAVAVYEEWRWSEGEHSGYSPNSWNSTAHSYGARVYAGTTLHVAAGTQHYRAADQTGAGTRRTTDEGLFLAVGGAPAGPPSIAVTERKAEGGYHHCVLLVGSTPVVDVPCGTTILEEGPIAP